ncbi:Hypothetical protein DHA2_152751 [Giardia duodenalis]|uniref:Uncharacterized protein n=1 Tax=Giardia intestinalis TaxID=5741 RepID=V6TKI7_GIAIN|nr:Hypothetical protein DHA2_152751 [Giardia intestinalis]
MSIASSVWFGIWDGMISLSSPSTLCLSSFASLRCSVSCLTSRTAGHRASMCVLPEGKRLRSGPPSRNSRLALWGSRR